MSTIELVGRASVRGSLTVPGDKSISHRALLISALAPGPSTVMGLSQGADVQCTRAAIEALGTSVIEVDEHSVRINGGLLHEPARVLDVGNSGTSIRLLTGLCAGFPFFTVIEGDASIARRPMDRVAEPLRLMGARIDGRELGRYPPLVVHGGELHAIDYELPVPSAQVKSAILFAGLHADGTTVVREPVPTRAHTEEMLTRAGADIERRGNEIRVRPSTLEPGTIEVPGDPSQAAYWVVAACVLPDSEIEVRDVYLGSARVGFVDVLTRMGADIDADKDAGTITARTSELRGTVIEPDEVPGLVDEIPILAVAAAGAVGETRFRGVGELRVKESDRLATICSELGRFTAGVEATSDELVVQGGGGLVATHVESHGDHRIAMAMAIAALSADGPTRIDGWDAVATSYPAFLDDLQRVTDDRTD